LTSFSWIWRFQHLKILGKLYSSHVLCPNVAIFLKNVFIFKDRTLKKNNIERTRILRWFDVKMRRMWFGLEIDLVGLPPLNRLWMDFNNLTVFKSLWHTTGDCASFTKTFYRFIWSTLFQTETFCLYDPSRPRD